MHWWLMTTATAMNEARAMTVNLTMESSRQSQWITTTDKIAIRDRDVHMLSSVLDMSTTLTSPTSCFALDASNHMSEHFNSGSS